MQFPQRGRTACAAVLLACAAVFIAVAVSQWLFGLGVDPRDDVLRRAAGIGFTDEARLTYFSVVPVAAPVLAATLVGRNRPGRVIRRLARILAVAYIVIGVPLTLSAAGYGFDETRQLAEEGQVFIDSRFAVERLLLDAVWLVLAGIGLCFMRWTGVRERSSIADPTSPAAPEG